MLSTKENELITIRKSNALLITYIIIDLAIVCSYAVTFCVFRDMFQQGIYGGLAYALIATQGITTIIYWVVRKELCEGFFINKGCEHGNYEQLESRT
jgi:hypothetical protein